MYTELIFSARLRPNISDNIVKDIEYLIGKLCHVSQSTTTLPAMFIKDNHGYGLFCISSAYLAPSLPPRFDKVGAMWELAFRCDVKDYNEEISTFLKWIAPHIYSGSGRRNMFAITIYEEDSEPVFYYLD